ncbi:aminotransferase-like domain-containing protein [Fusibacter ferrireducens]|uniref:PLP-dependent aminotransferase family protein n=1 Tax=Fusibacter ferrireducens TaxID=2785058 RepID=A0ABR9ZY28_9FIRM|nr:PLP-dependent aminotransferase family protein [Fusibacter ferrireducens]MBF4695058.1 PLP-dependent aminotransferase family protein [Fusibacter ferrireducens]
MNFEFSRRANNSAISLIRVISQKAVGNPDFISFAIGNPASDGFPVEGLNQASQKAFKENPIETLQYGATIGVPALREKILQMLKEKKYMTLEGNDVIVTTGSQSGLSIMPLVLCNDGDAVICDEFSFTSALNAFKGCGANLVGVKMDGDGMSPADLEEKIKANPNAKFIYLIPNFHNPMGITIPFERRKKLYEVAVKYNMPIYEDDPYGELIFRGDPQPTFKSIDTENIVVYAGSFSKTLAAGLRVGFLFGPSAFIGKATAAKGFLDSQTAILNQLIVYNFLKDNDYESHIAKVQKIYKAKNEHMLACLDKYMHPDCKRTNPNGGMFVWITMPDHVDCEAMFEDGLKMNLGIVPSRGFTTDCNNPGKSFRINYSAPTLEKISEGIKRFGKLTYKYCK